MNKNIYCVIMAGGIGSRFWPMSRTSFPKQFHDVLGTGRTLIQQTFDRFAEVCPPENVYVVTNQQYKSLVLSQLQELTEEQVLCEPAMRNTAPCIAYATHKIAKRDPEAVIVVAPSDHLILKQQEFVTTLKLSTDYAAGNDCLLTLGIKPNRPDTGYGYIQFTEEKSAASQRVKKVKLFTEKPNLDLAEEFLKSGDFYWNSGIFIWSVKAIRDAFKQHLPEIDDLFEGISSDYDTPKEEEQIANVYSVCENISIDYGILEKAGNVNVILSDFGWSDLGTWGSLFTHLPKDGDNNGLVGKNIVMYDSSDNIVNIQNANKLAVIQGLDDYIVVDTPEILLICSKKEEQKIKQIVTDLKMNKKSRYI